jgi:Tetracyclin repressor-like, C-terminal domain
MAGILRAAASEPEAAQMARELATERIVGAISESLGADDAPLRANLVASQSIGLLMARHILVSSRSLPWLLKRSSKPLAPNFQHYLTRPLGPRA